ncbi:MAG TPA: DUF305 domain-containing protein [Humisphaera sp.]|jgi:hypothetical protein|nr:DUF305 domain-containing protein [Humisphaera sp.]
MTIARRLIRLPSAILLCVLISSACAGNDRPTTDPGSGAAEHRPDADAASAMMNAMAKMDRDMAGAAMSGEADHDFAAMMIPHHQGAIDMAKVYLVEGKDPALRRLAQEIIVTQAQEIEVMRLGWRRFKPKRRISRQIMRRWRRTRHRR